MDNNSLEILKIVVPAISSFLGALVAGCLAIYASDRSAKRNHENSIQVLKLSGLMMTISNAYQKVMTIILKALEEKRLLKETEKVTISQLSIWMNMDVVKIIRQLLIDRTMEDFKHHADMSIDKMREVLGTN